MAGSEISIRRVDRLANRLITWLFNRLMRQSLTDVETCYKVFSKSIIDRFGSTLIETRFGCEIECAARIAKMRSGGRDRLANELITWLFSRLMRQSLTDNGTCYKVFSKSIIDRFGSTLIETRFGCEIECAARIAKMPGARVVERPIHYQARTRRQGKKIGWRDGVRALWCILRYR